MRILMILVALFFVSVGMAAATDSAETVKGTSGSGCWMKLYTAKRFHGRVLVFNGPSQIPTMRPADIARGTTDNSHLGIGQPDSLITGPNTSVVFYSRRYYRGHTLKFGPDSYVDELEDFAVGRTIDSFKIRCH